MDGAQTSAALMASDFLLEELDRQVIPHVDGVPITTGQNRASGGYAGAYGCDVDEYDDDENVEELEDAEMSAMWGGGGIPLTSDDEE